MRTGRPRKPVVLSEQGIMALNAIVNSRSLPHGLVTRAKIVLLSAGGLSNREIAAKVDYSPQSVWAWPACMTSCGPAVPAPSPTSRSPSSSARPFRVNPRAEPTGRSDRWSRNPPSRRRLSRGSGTPSASSLIGRDTSRFFVEKVRDIVGLYLNPPENALVLCVDEKSQIQALDRTQPALPMGLGYVEGLTHDYVRHGTLTLFAALDIASGKVLTKCKRRHRHQVMISNVLTERS